MPLTRLTRLNKTIYRYEYTYIYVYIYVYIYIRICVYTYMYMYRLISIYIYISDFFSISLLLQTKWDFKIRVVGSAQIHLKKLCKIPKNPHTNAK